MSTPPPPKRDRRPAFDRRGAAPGGRSRAYGIGIYRRRLILRRNGDTAVGELEDDFHHFRVAIEVDTETNPAQPRGTVVSAAGEGVRAPWTTCFDADEPLQALVGTALATGPAALSHLDARQNCTHMFDLAGLVVTHAARGVDGDRLYDMEVGDPHPTSGERTARLWRDGELVFDWLLRDRELISPAEWVDAPLWKGFIPWAAANLDDETAEAAVALRRACDISRGRMGDLDHFPTAESLIGSMSGICHSFQPHIAPVALRRRRSDRDFTDRPELLLADFDDRQP